MQSGTVNRCMRTPEEMLLIAARVWVLDDPKRRPRLPEVARWLGITDARVITRARTHAYHWLDRQRHAQRRYVCNVGRGVAMRNKARMKDEL